MSRQGSDWGGAAAAAAGFRRTAAARAARAWARSILSSLEPKKKGLVGDWRREAITVLCFCAVVGLGLRASAIERASKIGIFHKDLIRPLGLEDADLCDRKCLGGFVRVGLKK